MSRLTDHLLVFGRLLRRVGIEVPVGSMLDLLAALTHVDLGVRDEVFHTCRAVLVTRHDQLAPFAVAFDAFWRDYGNPFASQAPGRPREDRPGTAQVPSTAAVQAPEEEGETARDEEPSGALQTWSEQGGIATKDFAEFTPEEITRARLALEQLDWLPGLRRTRRWVPGQGRRIDLRRALARSLRTGGDLVTLPRRHRRLRPRPLVLLCDISGSMERYSRMLLHFAHGMGRRHRRLEAFVFSTGLTRITRELRIRRIDDAVAAVSRAVPDWSGGTRIGSALQQFHQR